MALKSIDFLYLRKRFLNGALCTTYNFRQQFCPNLTIDAIIQILYNYFCKLYGRNEILYSLRCNRLHVKKYGLQFHFILEGKEPKLDAEYKLRFDGITKVFPGVMALDDVSFGIKKGTVHVVMGENGA